jgi:hypothetical protein
MVEGFYSTAGGAINKTAQSWRVSAGLSALADEPMRKNKCAGQTKMKSKPQH